ncbi:PAS domain-containing sensor histidine kinase [Skermanella pratensis]|uniref:PAS domain-containing sensor histidine kinase n=1 Tax=Skermanella pratensis TaxID=2233999 RepID=UPI001B3B948C|nr:PAS-domain containing protein [Skermanella pratensis]
MRPEPAFDALFRLSPDTVTIADWTGADGGADLSAARIVYVNPAFTELTGYRPEEIAGLTPGILPGIDPPRRELVRIRRTLGLGQAVRTEIRGYAKDGREYWSDLTISPFQDAAGGRRLLLAVQRDVTARRLELDARRLERDALREANNRLQEAIDSVSQAITLWNPEGRLLLHNKRFAELFAPNAHMVRPGVRFERLLRANVEAGVYRIEGDAEEWVEARLQCRGECGIGTDLTVAFADGRHFRVSEQKTPRGHMVAAWVDVTEIRRIEQRLRDAIESVNEGFVLWDADQRLVLCNSRYKDLSPADSGEACLAPQAVRLEGEYEQELPDGRWLLGSYRRTSEGGIVGIRTDITLRKQQELKLKTSEESLRVHVAELEEARSRLEAQTCALSELASRYLTARDNAEEASRIKSQFLAMMSHELRTPLNAIIGFSEMIETQALGPVGVQRYVEYARDVHTSGRHLLELINDILDMSKIEAGKYVLHRTEVDISVVVRRCARMVRLRADEAGIDVVEDDSAAMPPGGVTVCADERALNQILLNLLSNAIKFTDRGGRVTISTEVVADEMHLAVTDTGIGIAPDDLDRVGTPFEQIDNRHTRRHAGTGLGLALTRSLTEMHGGRIDIRSELGVGTRVCVILPLSVLPQFGDAVRQG